MLNKNHTRFLQSLSWERQNRAHERKTPLSVGWWFANTGKNTGSKLLLYNCHRRRREYYWYTLIVVRLYGTKTAVHNFLRILRHISGITTDSAGANNIIFKLLRGWAWDPDFVFYLHFCICICILYLLHPIDNTLAVQYQLVQGCLNYVYITKKGN